MKAPDTGRTERRGVGIITDLFETLGFAFREQPVSDYGIDAHAERIIDGTPTGQLLAIQLKTGAGFFKEKSGSSFVFWLDEGHAHYWLDHVLLVIVCLCDPDRRLVFWESVTSDNCVSTGKGFKISVPENQVISERSLPDLENLLTPVIPATDYTILKTEDITAGYEKNE